jgi:beta-glucosidase
MKPYTPLFALGILFLVFTNSLLADPETGTAIKNQDQKLIAELPASSSSIDRTDATPAYKRADLPVDERVGDLLGRMTLEEKVRQLDMYYGCQDLVDKKQTIDNHTHAKPDAVFDPQFAEMKLGNLGAGSIHDLYPSAKLYNTVQAWVIKSSRLGIPALFLEEGLHGYMGYDQTVFPQSVNLAATWNPDLARILAPVLDVARDPRWGRVEEDFGEDPFLSGQLGLAYVRGMQGVSLATDHNVIAEPKHFAAHGSPD